LWEQVVFVAVEENAVDPKVQHGLGGGGGERERMEIEVFCQAVVKLADF
jgi:hypothetical protein